MKVEVKATMTNGRTIRREWGEECDLNSILADLQHFAKQIEQSELRVVTFVLTKHGTTANVLRKLDSRNGE